MICKKCGTAFEGNFCSNCGAPVTPQVENYPSAPVGEYKGSLCTVILSDMDLTIRKKILFKHSEEVIPYSELYNVSFKKGILGGFICVRSIRNRETPLSTSGSSASDPFSADFATATESERFYDIYRFLQNIITINDYPVYEPPEKEPIPSFDQQKQERTQDHTKALRAEPIHQSEPTKAVAQEKERPHKKSKQELKRDAHNAGQACCPKCGSTSLSANKKGYGVGKAVAGVFVAGPIGLVAGNLNAKKVWVTCLNCGKRWKI